MDSTRSGTEDCDTRASWNLERRGIDGTAPTSRSTNDLPKPRRPAGEPP
ncbi:hypothetical protein OH809_05730 [Streptomyces sp. NBC_00873]|nr:hypothetical protein OH809_05730 [Streptomyces sp. NBC_00873]WTA47687.1 hypothetical protein OH821_38040 [Streptomyces sp. NBC_00842]